jgi:antirestriction protein
MNTEIETGMQAWVGCLGCYNEGTLNGSWVDALEAGDVSKAVKVATGNPAIYGENCPVCVKCGSDEFWVFDHEGLEGLIKGECSPLTAQQAAEKLNEVSEDQREAFRAYIELMGDEVTFEDFEEAYIGEFSSETELAEYFIDNGLSGFDIPDNMAFYFDYEKYGRDLSFDLVNHDGHYFWNN